MVALDGFFTFAVGTRDGFAVLRDPVACKPAVMAETDDWVAMASEFRSLAHLPGANDAYIWEPAPATVPLNQSSAIEILIGFLRFYHLHCGGRHVKDAKALLDELS